MNTELENLNSKVLILHEDLDKQKKHCFEINNQLQQAEFHVQQRKIFL